MNFKEATDVLFEPVTHRDLAAAMGVSVASYAKHALIQPPRRTARYRTTGKLRPSSWRKSAFQNIVD